MEFNGRRSIAANLDEFVLLVAFELKEAGAKGVPVDQFIAKVKSLLMADFAEAVGGGASLPSDGNAKPCAFCAFQDRPTGSNNNNNN